MKANKLNLDRKAWFNFDTLVPLSNGLNNSEAQQFLANNCENQVTVVFKIYDDGKTNEKQIASYKRKLSKIMLNTNYSIHSESVNGILHKIIIRGI